MAETLTLWGNRFSWSSEVPLTYPELNPSALARFDGLADSGQYIDGVDSSRTWNLQGEDPQWYGRTNGPRGSRMQINGMDPETEQSWVQLEQFSGLWPDSGRVLVGLWVQQNYIMDFCPVLDTRNSDPFVYLSTDNGGVPRHQVYDESGSLLLDQYESGLPWAQTTDPYYLGMMVDGDEGYSQMFSVHSDGRTWVGSERSFSGSANFGATADLDVFALPHAGYYESGYADEITVAHPSNDFDLEQFVDDLGLSVYATGQSGSNGDDFEVTEERISNLASDVTMDTGAERLSWGVRPSLSGTTSGLQISTDDGDTWEDISASDLPETADGVLLRRVNVFGTQSTGITYSGQEITIPEVPDTEVTPEAPKHDKEANTVTVPEVEGVAYSYTGTVQIPEGEELTVTAEPEDGYTFPADATVSWTFEHVLPDPPTLAGIDDVVLEQSDLHTEQLDWSVGAEPYSWDVRGPSMVSVTVDDGTLSVAAGTDTGGGTVTVTLTDDLGRDVSQSFQVRVNARSWEQGPPPDYPHAPIILWDDDQPQEVLIDPLEAPITKEINGADTFEFAIPANHRHVGLIQPERIVEVAGERYWTRRITTERSGATMLLAVYAEARFYELSTAGQVDADEWDGVEPGSVMEAALADTEWSVDVVNVTTRRTYSTEASNPLELLRTVQENHGGDLVFDNTNRRVSLVTRSGRETGVAFFYGRGLSEVKQVVDTTSLVTRIIPRSAEGLGIESVNDGVAYVEDFSYTDEVRTAVYDFAEGTSPHTMLSMAQATLANRCQPDYSYEVTVSDLSAVSGEDIDRFDVGDTVTVVDGELGLETTQRIVKLEYDVVRPWASQITLSATLRETGSSDAEDAGTLQTGSGVSTFDLVPFNLLLNSRFDNSLAHWAYSGVEVVESEQGTGDYSVRFSGSGERWVEQTVQPDNREAYSFSIDVDTDGPQGWEPDLVVQAEVTYEDGETETINLDLA